MPKGLITIPPIRGNLKRTAVEGAVIADSALEARTLSATALSKDTQGKLHASLSEQLGHQLKTEVETLGLQPGDLVAISSSVGQSISF